MSGAPHNNGARDARDAPMDAPDDASVARCEAQLIMSVGGYRAWSVPDIKKVRMDVQACAVAQGLTPEMITAMDLQISAPPRTGGDALVFVSPMPRPAGHPHLQVVSHVHGGVDLRPRFAAPDVRDASRTRSRGRALLPRRVPQDRPCVLFYAQTCRAPTPAICLDRSTARRRSHRTLCRCRARCAVAARRARVLVLAASACPAALVCCTRARITHAFMCASPPAVTLHT